MCCYAAVTEVARVKEQKEQQAPSLKARKSPSFPPAKALSSVLLPWWEEEVEEGEHSPSPQSSPPEGRGRSRF
jgi:hypothetical protein